MAKPTEKPNSAAEGKVQKLMVTKTVRVSTISGILIFEQGMTFDDPALTGIILEHKIPHFVVPDEVPDDAVPVSGAPKTNA